MAERIAIDLEADVSRAVSNMNQFGREASDAGSDAADAARQLGKEYERIERTIDALIRSHQRLGASSTLQSSIDQMRRYGEEVQRAMQSGRPMPTAPWRSAAESGGGGIGGFAESLRAMAESSGRSHVGSSILGFGRGMIGAAGLAYGAGHLGSAFYQEISKSGDLTVAQDALLRSMRGAHVEFGNFKLTLAEMGKGLQTSAAETTDLTRVFASLSKDLSATDQLKGVRAGLGLAVGGGLDKGTSVSAMATGAWWGNNRTDMREFALMLARGIAGTGAWQQGNAMLAQFGQWQNAVGARGGDVNAGGYWDWMGKLGALDNPAVKGIFGGQMLNQMEQGFRAGIDNPAVQIFAAKAFKNAGMRDINAYDLRRAFQGSPFARLGGTGKTVIDALMDEQQRQSPGASTDMLDAQLETLFGLTMNQAGLLRQARGMAGAGFGGLADYIRGKGGLGGLNDAAISPLARLAGASDAELAAIRKDLDPTLTDQQRRAIDAAGSPEARRRALMDSVWTNGMALTEGSQLAEAQADTANKATELGQSFTGLKETVEKVKTWMLELTDADKEKPGIQATPGSAALAVPKGIYEFLENVYKFGGKYGEELYQKYPLQKDDKDNRDFIQRYLVPLFDLFLNDKRTQNATGSNEKTSFESADWQRRAMQDTMARDAFLMASWRGEDVQMPSSMMPVAWRMGGMGGPGGSPAPTPRSRMGNIGAGLTPGLKAHMASLETNYGLPRGLLTAIASVESSFNPSAISSAGAQGMFQIMPGTAGRLGVANPFDPYQGAVGAAKHLSDSFRRFGNWNDAITAYNAGDTKLANVLAGRDRLKQESIEYGHKVQEALSRVEVTVTLQDPQGNPIPNHQATPSTVVTPRPTGTVPNGRRVGA